MRIRVPSGRRASWAGGGALALLVAVGPALADEPPRLALFGFELVDTSLQGEVEGADPAEAARLQMIEAELRAQLEASGRYRLVDTAPAAGRSRTRATSGAATAARSGSPRGWTPIWR